MPREDSYDVVVVGGGLGGLSAAASLTKLGRRVLLLERSAAVGGCAHAFEREGGYRFDPAVHFMGAVNDGGIVDVYLRALDVRDLVEFIPYDGMYGVDFPGLRADFPLGSEAFIELHQRVFPGQADGIGAFLEACVRMTAESQQLPPRLGLRELDAAQRQFPFLFKYRMATVQDVLDDCIEDDRVKALCSAAWPYVGLPPSRLSFVTFCAVLLYALEQGPNYCRGSFQTLVDAFVTAIDRGGGEIETGAEVTAIDVRDGKVTGVRTAAGAHVRTDLVISNADAQLTFDRLVGRDHLPKRFVRRLERMTPSLSAFWVFAATTLDVGALGLPHEIFIHRHWDHDRNYQDALDGKLGGSWISLPTVADRTVAPEGEHLVIFTAHAPYDIGEPWDRAREKCERMALDEIERLLPGFRDGMTHCESATPIAFERWTGNHRGAIYGWENSPGQSTPRRLPRLTPIEGLLLCGHWTEPGTGALRAMYSGLQTAQLVGGYETLPDVLHALSPERAERPGR